MENAATAPTQYPTERAAELAAKPFLTRAEAAEYAAAMGYPTARGTLQKFASIGGGPEYQICGRNALYKPSVVLKWSEGRLSPPRHSTSEPTL